MSLIPQIAQSPEQIYAAARADSILATARALNAAAAVFKEEHEKFYARGLGVVLDDLNVNPASGLALFQTNTLAAEFINPALVAATDALTAFGGTHAIAAIGLMHRVPEAPALAITYDQETGLFVEIISQPDTVE